MIAASLHGRRVLVTGHTGFKGSWLAQWLLESGAEVVGYALEPRTERDHFVAAGLAGRMDSVIGDVRDRTRLFSTFERSRPDVVFHLAAQALVRPSYEEPSDTFETNVVGTANVLDAVRRTESVAATVVITSDKCYRNNEWVWGYRERDVLGGHDPYSASKACEELVVASYRDSFFAPHGRPLASVRAGNVIGGGDWCDHRIVPDAVRSLEAGEAAPVRNPHSTRPWQHVLEPLGGYLLLAARMLEDPAGLDEAWNFGPDAEATVAVGRLADLLVDAWGSGRWTFAGEPGAVHEAGLLALDCAKAKARLGWCPLLTVEEAVSWTVEWYRGRLEGADCYALAAAQIAGYERRAAERWPALSGGEQA